MAMEMSSFQREMVLQQRPVMSTDIFLASMKGDGDVLIQRLELLKEEKEIKVTIETSHSASEQIKHQPVQSELQSATRFGDTVLHVLVTKGHNKLALMVFRRDVSLLKSPNNNSETPLHCAAKVGNENVIHNLIQIDHVAVKDALKQTTENGDTALHIAAIYNHKDISLALMQLDPEVPYRVNKDMFSALHIAIDREYNEMVETMLEQDHTLAYTQFSTGMFPVHLAASMGNMELVMHLWNMYPDCAELLDPQGRNLLHFAAEENKHHIFHLKPENTSEQEIFERITNAQDYEGNTPLHIAAIKGHRRTMKAIWKNKMNDVAETIQNKQGLTPFEISKRQMEETYENIGDHYLIDKYHKTQGYKFTRKWFDEVMQPRIFENKWERTQVIGLGSVLITTVAFAAALTVPGGYNQDLGTPVLGRRYMFRAFILANTLAFTGGLLSLISLLVNASVNVTDNAIGFAIGLFWYAACSMGVAFGLGMYVILAPVCLPIAVLLLVVTLFLGTPCGVVVIVLGQEILGPMINYGGNDLKDKYYLLACYVMTYLFIFCLAFM